MKLDLSQGVRLRHACLLRGRLQGSADLFHFIRMQRMASVWVITSSNMQSLLAADWQMAPQPSEHQKIWYMAQT